MDVAAIDGITGPGRHTTMIQGDVQELTFRLKKKTIEVILKDGSMGQYDLKQVSAVQIVQDGDDYVLAIVSNEKETKDGRTETRRGQELIDYWTDTINERSTKIGRETDESAAARRESASRSDKERREAESRAVAHRP